MISWFWFFSVLVALIAGFAISVYLNRKTDTEHKLKQEFDSLNLEYQNYQNQVRAHFNRTSELLAEYQQQHQHLQAHIFSAAQGFGNIHSSEFGSMSTNDSISKTDYVSPHLLRNKTFDFENPFVNKYFGIAALRLVTQPFILESISSTGIMKSLYLLVLHPHFNIDS